ncbi:histone-lysine N-methyltransferase ATX2-like isoform X2 [Cynara cardunculus var. scolymus]|uniref:histone-lysine N-methyltransferase ATX2-like isoform X2 n=1 Tax=Cynara cardunculus var. scolymus TaxID=59895 RepID=UPI000D62AE1C|nr:histone-lysine N-methyltransferase ATX2-like isoform X2 [Cynara cardunculus var. scolymus]
MAFSSQLLTPNANNKQREDDEEEAPPEEQKVLIQSEEDHRHHHQARKYPVLEDHNDAVSVDPKPPPSKPPVIHVYSRCRRRKRSGSFHGPSGYDIFLSNLKTASVVELKEEDIEFEGEDGMMGSIGVLGSNKKRKTSQELINLGLDSVHLDAPRLRGSSRKPNRANDTSVGSRQRRSKNDNGENNWQKNGHENEVTEIDNTNKSTTAASRTKRWVRLKFDGVDPEKFVGLQCKVYWPLDADWYCGCVAKYDLESHRHHVEYEDGDEERVILSKERIKFHVSPEEIKCLRLTCDLHCSDTDDLDVNEMIVLAANLDDCHDIEPGDIIWAKLTGHAVWPAIVLDESFVSIRRGLSKVSGEKSVLVQFFGTHDFARVKTKQVISFLKGLLSSYHLKCKKLDFIRSLEEAKMYLSRQKLPKSMLQLRNGVGTDSGGDNDEDECSAGSKKRCLSTEIVHRKLKGPKNCPFVVGDLEVLKLGKVVKNLDCFDVEKSIWPLGYTATRKFPSLADPSVCSVYKMEVLRDAGTKTRPVFRVTTDDGDQFDGSDPAACWNKVYDRIRKMHSSSSDNSQAEGASVNFFKSGADMFGFSDPHVLKLIQGTSDSKLKSGHDMPIGYRPVHVKWKDLDKCNVCHMDEEYANNLFLQCDKCRMMVHARCYGELEPVDGVLWLCNLCRTGAPEFSPPCCLCPVTGGAMKPTTDGRWAHLACAMWIPETCLSDIKKMEPIDGLNRISKDRWKLLCSICGVPYGACIQCSNNACYVAYHPLCARAAGFCAELADVDRLQLVPIDEDEENQCIRLLSFCKKHSPNPLIERIVPDERMGRIPSPSDYTRPVNPSGCARCEPYDYFGRRGRKEPEALAAASLKRAYVENRPYLVGGFCQHESLSKMPSFDNVGDSKLSFGFGKLKNLPLNGHTSIFSMSEKYIYMRRTFRKRLAFGKSGIHGFGIFAKQPHKAGDMVIEYTGEIVRPPIADRREHLIYNSLVGAGTYMFRIDDERVIDATRAGSIAHLINHSCEPNCYSRVISVNGDEHIIIFAKRDIAQWEELTYDYRFFSIDEQLACYCGFPSCRGVVNDIDAEVQMAKLYAPRSELKDWEGE